MISKWFVLITLLYMCGAMELQVTKIEKRFRNTFPFENIIHQDKKGQIKYKDGVMTFFCRPSKEFEEFKDTFVTEIAAKIENKAIDAIAFETCKFTQTTFKEELMRLNIDTDKIETLAFSTIQLTPLPPGNYTAGLQVKHLFIEVPTSKTFLKDNPDFLLPLNLTTLQVIGTEVPPIPSTIKLRYLSIVRANISSIWDNCEDLEEFSVTSDFGPLNIPKNWPSECNKLKALQLMSFERDPYEAVISSLNTTEVKLESLEVLNCRMNKLPTKLLWDSRNTLKRLNVHNNLLTDDLLEELKNLQNLTDLDLSMNKLDGVNFNQWSSYLKNVRNLNLDNNNFISSFCYFVSLNSNNISESLSSLEHLSLKDVSEATPTCFGTVQFAKLEYLGLTSSPAYAKTIFKELKLQDMPTSKSTHLEVDLSGRNINRIMFDDEDYKALRSDNSTTFWGAKFNGKTNIKYVGAKLNCDCENYWLARAVRESLALPFQLEFTCHTGDSFDREPIETMDCIKMPYEMCTVRSIGTWGSDRKKSNGLNIDCHGIKENFVENFPEYDYDYYKVVSLNVSDNQIVSLNEVMIFDTMTRLDLRSNSIARMDENDTSRLFSKKDLRIWLSGNQFVCDCKNNHLIDVLQENRNQIEDFYNIICIDSGKPLHTVSSYEICKIGLKIGLGILGAILTVLLITAFVIWWYRIQIKLYLYSRGLCLSCLTDNDLDSDRPFDAFLSYAHGDETYVVEQLLSKLESEPDKYRILVHFRDWVIGDWIPAQIMKSVQLSKRTIIVLSKNFVGSMWGSLEFRYAVATAGHEGRKRLLVLILDDVLAQPLDPEIEAYIAFNTYLSCDDPWFWEKLRYAMPHKAVDEKKGLDDNQGGEIRVDVPQDEGRIIMQNLRTNA